MAKGREQQRTNSPDPFQSIVQAGAKGSGKKDQLLGSGGKGRRNRHLEGQMLSYTESPASFWCIFVCTAQQQDKPSAPSPQQ